MTIQKTDSDDSEVLTGITKKSKAHWGYTNDQIESWAEALTITKTYIETNWVYKLVIDIKIVGYYSFVYENANTIKLDNLFLLPECIGKGMGKMLMEDFLIRAKKTNAKKIFLDSDPHAEKFYAKFGFTKIGQIETAIKGRYLPVMELNL